MYLAAELLLKMIIEAEIGKRIRQYRLRNNFTLQELADKTGFSKGYLSKVEKSGKAPPVATISVIARELGASVSVILGEETIGESICLVRENERMLMAKNGQEFGYAYEALANPYPNKHMEPLTKATAYILIRVLPIPANRLAMNR